MMAAPDFIQLDGRKLDEFLNHRGNFTPDERELFAKLCKSWEPVIPYRRFLRHIGDNTENRRLLDSLLEKLFQAGVAVRTTSRGEDGSLVPQGIVLTEDRSARFYKCAVDEYIRAVRFDIEQPLPFADKLAESGLRIPDAFLTDVDASNIATLLSESGETNGDNTGDESILRITTQSGLQLVITSGFTRSFLGLSMRKLRHLLENANTLAAIARLLDSSLTVLRQKIDGKEPRFWFRLTETILTERERLKAQRNVPVDEDFFAAAEILHAFVDGQISEFRRRKAAEQERQETIESILTMLSELDSPVIAVSDLKSLIESYREVFEDDFEEFRNDFFETALKSPGRRKAPALAEFDDVFIHRDRLYPFFLGEIERIHTELRNGYIQAMRHTIRGRRRYDAFFSHTQFVSDIEETLRQQEPLFLLMYESPEAMSEALLHWAKEQGMATDQSRLRKLLGRHFEPGTTQFVPIDVLLDLRLDDIFESAFRSLAPLWQLIYRIFGRYEALRERYSSEQAKRNQTEAVWKASEKLSRENDSAAGNRRSSRGPRGNRESRGEPANRPSSLPAYPSTARPPVLTDLSRTAERAATDTKTPPKSPKQKSPKQRYYTRRESERAWEEFKRRIES